MLYHEFLHLTHSYAELIKYLAEKGVIRDQTKCPQCNTIIHLNTQLSHSLTFHCTGKYYKQIRGRKRKRQTCNFKISAVTGTWFARAALNLPEICRLICYFTLLNSPRQLFLQTELSMSSRTVVDWTNFCRELLAQWVSNGETQIGGSNIIVEIDEAKFGRRKYHRGRLITGQWLFGAVERDTGRLFVVPVEKRSSEVLIPIIRRRIAPGTIIHSDCWRAYDCLSNYSYVHKKVNHTENFVDPHTGVHTQNIERLWRDIRGGIPRYGTRKEHYIHYISEFIFKRKYQYDERIDKFFEIMASLYPLQNN